MTDGALFERRVGEYTILLSTGTCVAIRWGVGAEAWHGIVIYGAPLVGKTTMLQAFAKARSTQLHCYAHLDYRRMRVFVPVPAKHFEIEVTTFGGAMFSPPTMGLSYWDAILPRASALVLVIESALFPAERHREYVDALLRRNVSAPGCVVQGMCDRPRKYEDSGDAIRDTPFSTWPTFSCSKDKPSSLLAPIEWAIEAMRLPDAARSAPVRTTELAGELRQRLSHHGKQLAFGEYHAFLHLVWDRDMTPDEAFALDLAVRIIARGREIVLQRVRGTIRYCLQSGDPERSTTVHERGTVDTLDDAVGLAEEHLLGERDPRQLKTRRVPR